MPASSYEGGIEQSTQVLKNNLWEKKAAVALWGFLEQSMPHKASMWKELFGAFTQEEVKQMLDFLNISCSTGYGVLL